ncbi:MAG: hypothetical protein O2884_10995 [Chloroflexi bacterium]|nr:hypothetical protein [Chloroflexota bacterium]
MQSVAIRLGLVSMAAMVVFAVWMVWIRDSGELIGGEAVVRLYTAEQDAIVSVAIETGGQSAHFTRNAGVWTFEDPQGLIVNIERWGGIVLLLSGPQVERELGHAKDLSDFGLDVPTIVDLTLGDDTRIRVLLGDRTPDERHHYATVGDDGELFLVNADWGNVLMALVEAPPYPYWYYRVDPKLVRVLEVDRDRDRSTMFLGIDPEQPDGGRVVIAEAARDMTSSEYERALSLAGGPTEITVLLPGDRSDSDRGFAAPTMTVRLTYQLSKPVDARTDFSTVYSIGAPTDDGRGYYATTLDTPFRLVFDSAWVEAMAALSDALR